MTIYYKEILDAGYYTYHFGVKMKFSSSLKINRENYAAIDKKNSFWSRKNYERNPEYYRRNYELFSGKYADETCSQYSDKWCREHKEACLNNFDYNMEFFKKINKAHFENVLNGLLTYSEHIKEISELYNRAILPDTLAVLCPGYRPPGPRRKGRKRSYCRLLS